MAITTLDQVGAGAQPPREFWKTATPTLVNGRLHSLFYLNGIPGGAAAPTPGVNGAALTSYAGQLPFTNPAGGAHTHLSRFVGQTTIAGQLWLCDRLWHNSGLSVTSTSSQSITSPTWPARDLDGTTDGRAIRVGVEVVTATGAGTPTLTLGYTSSTGASGRTGTNFVPTVATSAIGAFYIFDLQAGDVGVRSIQSYQQSATWTSGSISLVAFRIIARLEMLLALQAQSLDWITGGGPRMYDDTVPFLLFLPTTTTATVVNGHAIWTQG